jgi:hypothetical protein
MSASCDLHEFLHHIRQNIPQKQYAEDMILNQKKVLGPLYEITNRRLKGMTTSHPSLSAVTPSILKGKAE